MSSLSCGIVGLPNVGKSTIFSALTNVAAESANYPFTTIEPNIAVVDIPDSRLTKLHNLLNSKKNIPTSLKFVDIAGLVEGASKGEGLGNKFLANIREVDAIAHILRCFEGEVTHVLETVDPIRDLEIINLELAISDLQILEKRLTKLEKLKKGNNKDSIKEFEIVKKISNLLNDNRNIDLEKDFDVNDLDIIRQLNLISTKPMLYVLNYGNESINEDKIGHLKETIEKKGGSYIEIYGLLESEIKDLNDEEKNLFLDEYDIKETGLKVLISKAYSILNLITFYTAGTDETRAWSIMNNTKAPIAAGKIHSDFQKGFIRAEIIGFEDYMQYGSEEAVKNKGLIRSEGKEYLVKDGDIIHFRYNV
ncbi:MAG: redox-regulated ATPase YchF [Spirochaetales bacterium]|nr:redox-regulated ATPase YchF [Spirochaetales bacterium]|tara:strand:- start:10361 stop:11452 length:1092 start_codon:yes stop_codon:yes gene_type:complete